MWREDCWHQKTSFTYRFIVCKLQTCFILHCSFAEVNSWERQRETERLVIEAEPGIFCLVLTALSGPAFTHLILSTAHLNWPANHKGHWLCMVSERLLCACVCLRLTFDVFLYYHHPFIPFVNWPLCGGFIMPLDCFHYGASFTWISCYIWHTLTSPQRSRDYSHSEH